jgi:uncharacterized protein YdgA (DUF945 family)
MKYVVGLVASALAIIFGLMPYGFGVRIEQTFTALVQLAAHSWHLPMYTTRYRRGWFGSTADTFVELPPAVAEALRPYLPQPPPAAATPQGLTITHHLRHGPFPLVAHPPGGLSLLPVQTSFTSSLAPGGLGAARAGVLAATLPALQVYTTVFLHGASQSHVVLPAFAYPPGDPTEAALLWNGLQGDISVAAHGEHATGVLRTPGLKFVADESVVVLHDAVTRSEVWTGRRQPDRSATSVRVGAVAVTGRTAEPSSWAMTGGEVRATTTVADATLEATVDVQLDALRLVDVPYGPGTSHLELRRLPMAGLTSLLREVMAHWQNGQDLATLWRRLEFSEELARQLPELLRLQPEIALTHLRLHTAAGDIRASVQVRLDGKHLLAPAYLQQLLQTIDARVEGEAPASWVQATLTAQVSKAMRTRHRMAALLPPSALNRFVATLSERYLQSLVEREYLRRDGNIYKSQARYLRGQWLVNGKPLHLHDLAP